MLKERLQVPRLYLYSADDHLCRVQELEALLKEKEKQ